MVIVHFCTHPANLVLLISLLVGYNISLAGLGAEPHWQPYRYNAICTGSHIDCILLAESRFVLLSISEIVNSIQSVQFSVLPSFVHWLDCMLSLTEDCKRLGGG
jgi:hypothetical protein